METRQSRFALPALSRRRRLVIAGAAAAVLIGGGGAAASAAGADNGSRPATATTDDDGSPPSARGGDDRDGRDDDAGKADLAKSVKVDVKAAVDAALAAVPGAVVTSVDLDDDRGKAVWEVEVTRSQGERELVVDAGSGKVLANTADDDRHDGDDDD